MKVDHTGVAQAVINCWKDQPDKAAETDISARCIQHKALGAGFLPGKAPVRELRQRAKASLGTLPGLNDHFKDLLIRTGLSQSILGVLSEAALADAAAAPCDLFGRAETASVLLQDSRELVRRLSFDFLEHCDNLGPRQEQRPEAKKKLASDLKPPLAYLMNHVAQCEWPLPPATPYESASAAWRGA